MKKFLILLIVLLITGCGKTNTQEYISVEGKLTDGPCYKYYTFTDDFEYSKIIFRMYELVDNKWDFTQKYTYTNDSDNYKFTTWRNHDDAYTVHLVIEDTDEEFYIPDSKYNTDPEILYDKKPVLSYKETPFQIYRFTNYEVEEYIGFSDDFDGDISSIDLSKEFICQGGKAYCFSYQFVK